MSQCTVEQVTTDAMIYLGDSAGEITQELVTYFGMAYSELVSILLKLNAQEALREVYFTLPRNTNVIFPEQLGVEDFAEPQQLWERGDVNSVGILSVTDGSPIIVETDAPYASGSTNKIEMNGIEGVPAWVNRDWFITPIDATHFSLNGSYSTDFITTSAGGTAMWSNQQFARMTNSDVFPVGIVENQILGCWRWTENAIYVPGAKEDRQVYIEYLADDTPPISGAIGLCQGRERQFLANATAARFAMGSRQMPMGPALMMAAYGASGEADGTGGLLRQLLAPIWRQQSQLPRRMGLIRPRRGIAPVIG